MKIICSKEDLKQALMATVRALPTNPQTPILKGIYFSAHENILEMQATDFALGIIAKIPAEIEEEGAIVLDGKLITEIVNKSAGDIVTLETVEQTALIHANATKFTLPIMEAGDFPKTLYQQYSNSFVVQNSNLKKLIAQSAFACADDKDARPIFQGCCVVIENGALSFVATNTHRLVISGSEVETEISGAQKFIIPAKDLMRVLAILNLIKDERGVKVEFSDKNAAFWLNNIYVTCRLIDGAFPDYEKIIPKDAGVSAIVTVEDLLEAVSRVEIVSRETEYNTVKLKFDGEGLELSAESYNAGKVAEYLNAQVEGQIEIAFNLKYIKEFLRVAPITDKVSIKMNEPLSPALFTLFDDTNITYVITPVRTQ